MLDLARRDQIAHRARDIFHRHRGIDPVLVQQIDPVGPQPRERGIDDRANVIGPAVEVRAGGAVTGQVEAELGGDHHAVAQRRQRFAQQFFIGERAIDFGGVEQGHPAFHRRAQQRDHRRFVGRRAIRPAHPHAAQSKRRNFEPR